MRHHLVYAGLLRQDHLERTVRQRFPGPPPRGLVAAVERAAGAWLDLNPATVRQRRKWLTACRRGDRHAVRPLAD